DGGAEPAERGEEDRLAGDECAGPPRKAARDGDEDAAEDPAHDPTKDAADRDRRPVARAVQESRGLAEIGVVAEDGERGDAGDDDRGQDEPARPLLEATAHLLDREDDAGERRVEGGGDSGGAAGEDETAMLAA